MGSLARWFLTSRIHAKNGDLPWGTWTENVTGGLLLGVLMVFITDVWPPHRYLRPFLGVGVLGGYTTFSTYMLDTHTVLFAGHRQTALIYLVGTLLTGLLAVWVGIMSARAIVGAVARRHRRRRHSRDADTPVPAPTAGPPDPARAASARDQPEMGLHSTGETVDRAPGPASGEENPDEQHVRSHR